MTIPNDVAAYLTRIHSIPGWFSVLDARLITEISRVQRLERVRGDLLEIGAYRGRSAVLLGYLAGPGERLVVCDPFEGDVPTEANRRDNARWYPGLNRGIFEGNYLRFHMALPTIVAAPSSELVARIGSGRDFRLVHVDGSHQYCDVVADLAIARALLTDGGVAILDDYRLLHAPGVAAAVWRDVALQRLRPICLTEAKMYAAWTAAPPGLTDALVELAERSGWRAQSLPMDGYDVVVVDAPFDPPGGPRPSAARRAYWTLASWLRCASTSGRAASPPGARADR